MRVFPIDMKSTRWLTAGVALTAVALLAACTGAAEKATPTSTAAKSATSAATAAAPAKTTATATATAPAKAAVPPAPTTPTTAITVKDTSGGKILVDNNGMTLYTFKNDPTDSTKSVCNGNCANVWPPAFAPATGSATKPAEAAAALTVITRDDGAKQLAYNGMPLYRFNQDTAAGDAKGEAIANWLFARP